MHLWHNLEHTLVELLHVYPRFVAIVLFNILIFCFFFDFSPYLVVIFSLPFPSRAKFGF